MKSNLTKGKKVIFGSVFLLLLLGLFGGLQAPQKVTAASKYPYLIKVNKKMNTVTVYKKNSKGKYTVPVKAMICSTGKNTPIGTFKTKAKYRWKWLYGNVYGQYSTRITGPILFHSVYYYKKSAATLSIKEFNKLGTSASMGCVRLQVKDTKWIYDHCGIGTTVVIYNSSNPGPLGKPTAIKLTSKIKWDPTDTTNKSNPYNKKKPTISGVKSTSITYGSTFNPKKGLVVKDTCGNTITKQVKISGNVNTKVAATYSVTYSVTDLLNRTAKKTIKVTVKPKSGMPTLSGVSNKVYNYNTYKSKELKTYVLKGVSATVGTQKLGSAYLKYSVKTVTNNSSMVKYEVTYKVTNGSYTALKKAYITLDKQAPVITGLTDREMTKTQLGELIEKLVAKDCEDVTIQDNCTALSKLVVTTQITQIGEAKYQLSYTVKDEAGFVATKKVTIQIIEEPEPDPEPTPDPEPEPDPTPEPTTIPTI